VNPQPRGRYRRNVTLYYGFAFFNNFALWGGVWIKYLVEERGLELRWILAMDLPFWLLVAVLQAPMGALADHVGRRLVLASGAAAFALTILGFGLTTNYWMLFFDYVLWAVALSLYSSTESAMLYDSLREEGEEARYQKIAGRGFGAGLAAGMGGVILGGLVANVTSLAFTVQVSAVMPLVAMGCALAMREPPRKQEERHYWQGLKAGLDFAWRIPQVRYTLLIGAVLLTGAFGPVVLVQPFLIDHNVGTELYGVYQAPLRLVSVVAALLAFRVGGRLGIAVILPLACAGIVASYGGLAALDVRPAFAFFGVSALFAGLTRPLVDAYLNERIPNERRATVLSVMQLGFSLQVAFFEPALGFLADDISMTSAFVFAAAYFAIAMPPLLLLWRRANAGVRVEAPAPAMAGTPGS
jgi:MFS family permease